MLNSHLNQDSLSEFVEDFGNLFGLIELTDVYMFQEVLMAKGISSWNSYDMDKLTFDPFVSSKSLEPGSDHFLRLFISVENLAERPKALDILCFD